MAEQDNQNEGTTQNDSGTSTSQSGGSTESGGANMTGDPGSTPGSAEGDRDTVEEDLKDKGLDS